MSNFNHPSRVERTAEISAENDDPDEESIAGGISSSSMTGFFSAVDLALAGIVAIDPRFGMLGSRKD